MFCFDCLKQWADIETKCPTCKDKFTSVKQIGDEHEEVRSDELKAVKASSAPHPFLFTAYDRVYHPIRCIPPPECTTQGDKFFGEPHVFTGSLAYLYIIIYGRPHWRSNRRYTSKHIDILGESDFVPCRGSLFPPPPF